MKTFQERLKTLGPGLIALAGAPFDEYSSYLKGPAAAPEKIREAFHSPSGNYFTEGGIKLFPHPQIMELGDMIIRDYMDIEEQTNQVLLAGANLLTLGGDHSITYPIIKGHARHYDRLNILQLDAHGDLYPDFDGNRFSHACTFARIMEEGLVQRLIQVGVRTLTDEQRDLAKKYGVEIIEMKQWRPDKKLNLSGPLYLSLDLDVLDPAFVPGISHYEPGGMTTRELIDFIHRIDAPLIGADIVEYNPNRDHHGMTAMVAARLMKEILTVMLKEVR